MSFGLNDRHWKIVREKAVDPLKARQARVWVFGSRARGDEKPFSDLDLLYEAPEAISLSDLSRIREQLEESHLPIRVDLVDLRELAPAYRQSALRDRKEV